MKGRECDIVNDWTQNKLKKLMNNHNPSDNYNADETGAN